MPEQPSHVQLTEITRETIPMLNWMIEDLFCVYGVNMPFFLLDFSFSDYSDRPDWITYTPPDWYLPEWKLQWPTYPTQWAFPEFSGFNFNVQWGQWDYWLASFNELLGLLFDTAELPRWQMPDLSPASIDMLNTQISALYDDAGFTEISAEDEDNYLPRIGWGSTYAAAKTDYTDDPTWYAPVNSSNDLITQWYVSYTSSPDEYGVIAVQNFLKFDTSAWSGIFDAKFKISGMTITQAGWTENPILQIYEYNYNEPFGSGDWTGGTKIAEQELTAGSTSAEIIIDSTKVNVGGDSKYRFILKAITDENFFPTAPNGISDYLWVIATDVKLAVR